MPVTIRPLPVPHVLGPGVDLAKAILAALRDAGVTNDLVDGDVLVVASKVVALAEERLVPLPAVDDRLDGQSSHDGRRALARQHSRRIVADHPRALIVETAHGFVCANAGLDTSNVPPGHVLLLPEDPDDSAARLRADLGRHLGVDLGIVVGDTFGRPWRQGQVEVAIGVAGIHALRDERGGHDLLGTRLDVTVAAVADEVAGMADLVRDKATPVPFVLVSGLDLAGEGSGRDLVRDPAHDLFPAGGPTLAEHAVTAPRPGAASPGPPDLRPLDDVLDLVRARLPDGAELVAVDRPDGAIDVQVLGTVGPAMLLAVGAALEDLRILVAARGRPATVPRPGADGMVAVVTIPG